MSFKVKKWITSFIVNELNDSANMNASARKENAHSGIFIQIALKSLSHCAKNAIWYFVVKTTTVVRPAPSIDSPLERFNKKNWTAQIR